MESQLPKLPFFVMDAFTTDPLRASAHIRAVCERVRAFDRALSVGPLAPDPFRGQTTIGKTWRHEVLSLRDFEPMRQPLIGYIDRLLERRLNLGVDLQESSLSTALRHPPRVPFNEPGTYAERRLLALAVAADAARRDEAQAAFRVIEGDVAALSAVRVLRFERYLEIEGRLGARLTAPVVWESSAAEGPPGAEVAAPGDSGIERLARAVLASTKDGAQADIGSGWAALMHAITGDPAVEGWPARLASDSLLELLGGSWLVAGLRLESPSLPPRVCPASFPRAARNLGVHVYRAAVPETLPFVLARSPGELQGRAFGRTLALWFLSPAFARRRLGLGAAARARHLRGATRLLLAEVRLLAARARLAEAGRHSRTRLDQTWEELGLDLCAGSWGPPLGLLPARPDAGLELVAHLWALGRQAEFVATYDEDYLDNPRAREALLAEAHAVELPPPALDRLLEVARGLAG